MARIGADERVQSLSTLRSNLEQVLALADDASGVRRIREVVLVKAIPSAQVVQGLWEGGSERSDARSRRAEEEKRESESQ
ncbi:zinc ion binding protein [Actinidia rufa]|uniref:Zinc ion binding protein n=1 Tax=Actinidia rufa TaxID=165716 RepID=A0A7J0F408_9ERIC|nr:zinc ion binding protein [Actinidia rufa]